MTFKQPMCGGRRAVIRGLVGESEAMRRVRELLPRIAKSDCTVLITGETGTGKECVARALHRLSRRSRRPMVSLNCAALPDTLLENELFGHEAGAYTGATASAAGRLEAADGGTVFFDEVGDMTPLAQAKVLRAIEERSASRLGGDRQRRFDVRFVSATNQPLGDLVDTGRFRRDLYYRLNVVRIELPPLMERREDIPLLVRHLLARRPGGVETVSDACLDVLMRHDWPGNVRELANVLEAASITADRVARPADLPPEVRRRVDVGPVTPPTERQRVMMALEATHWNKSRAAARLRWSRMTLYRKMARLGIDLTPAGESNEEGVEQTR